MAGVLPMVFFFFALMVTGSSAIKLPLRRPMDPGRHGANVSSVLIACNNKSTATEEKRSARVREAIRHLWHGYKNSRAFGADEVAPLTGEAGGNWGEIGMMVLDTLDTLWIAGLNEEFGEGEQFVRGLNFTHLNHEARTSMFEIIIRGLGGLLSAHALSGHAVFVEKAKVLGDRLMDGFPGPRKKHAWPVSYIDVHHPSDQEVTPSFHRGVAYIADVASNVLEFSYLSQATGKPRYEAAAVQVLDDLRHMASSKKEHLLPFALSSSRKAFTGSTRTVGSKADSYYEYLLKRYLQSGKVDVQFLDEWKKSMQEMRRDLLHTTPGGLVYIASDSTDPQSMEHLSCFVGGMLALGAMLVPEKDAESWWLPTGEAITRTCYELYRQSRSGLAPDTVAVEGDRLVPKNPEYRLRPETLESLFYMYHATGNETYRDWSWNIFSAIDKHERTPYGFASASDVTSVPVRLTDSEETFMGAETLKYAFLIHQPCSRQLLEKYVFNTEAHPLPVKGAH
eukprot:gnl/TRDRNA2_/TRDRNA2_109586_c0_seq1.p1 gnl/TRDRNA2_/TRDRNA2_109586_c0~~gnl/TRDRNA2_/TRDRNA2_109586_c0_seq1.p1  ORF type:complete len:526 (-),score=59.30 gnl/TRDRNA2_/TRDRNA2_109586_c0_seq1:106-1629(-)